MNATRTGWFLMLGVGMLAHWGCVRPVTESTESKPQQTVVAKADEHEKQAVEQAASPPSDPASSLESLFDTADEAPNGDAFEEPPFPEPTYPKWTYDGQLHEEIAKADRIVVRHGGFDCCGPVDRQRVLFVITDPGEIREVHENLQFVMTNSGPDCQCCGYPGIDWYEDGTRVALTSLQHSQALRWKEFPSDASLTRESSQWIVEWLVKHGVPRKSAREGAAPEDDPITVDDLFDDLFTAPKEVVKDSEVVDEQPVEDPFD